MGEFLKIASKIQENNKDEAVAIENYSLLLEEITDSDIPSADKEKLFDIINEIISDELNHQQRLQEAYTMLTNIKPNEV